MYIAIEGIDGSGKDTLARKLTAALGATQISEPNENHTIGMLLRGILQTGEYRESHAAMFHADRMATQAMTDFSKPVVSVRSYMSTLVYQGRTAAVQEMVNEIPRKPGLIILLDLDPAVGLKRAQKRGHVPEAYENLDTLAKARDRYLSLVDQMGCKVLVVDASMSVDVVWERVQDHLGLGDVFLRQLRRETGMLWVCTERADDNYTRQTTYKTRNGKNNWVVSNRGTDSHVSHNAQGRHRQVIVSKEKVWDVLRTVIRHAEEMSKLV